MLTPIGSVIRIGTPILFGGLIRFGIGRDFGAGEVVSMLGVFLLIITRTGFTDIPVTSIITRISPAATGITITAIEVILITTMASIEA